VIVRILRRLLSRDRRDRRGLGESVALRGLLAVGCALGSASCGLDVSGLLDTLTTTPAPDDASTPLDAASILTTDGGAEGAPAIDAAREDAPHPSDASEPEDGAVGPRDASTDAPTGPPPLCDGSSSLLACFRFEGAVIDESPAAHPVTTDTGVAFVAGHEGLAAQVGANSAIRLPAASDWNVAAVTLEAWVHPSSLPAAGARMGVFDSDGRSGMFLFDDGIHCLMPDELRTGVLTTGVWTHVACVHDGASVSVYVNGALLTSIPATTPPGQSATGTIAVGGNAPSGDPFDGEIDSLRVWSVARSAGEIAAAAQR
jgi:hypothetical protein